MSHSPKPSLSIKTNHIPLKSSNVNKAKFVKYNDDILKTTLLQKSGSMMRVQDFHNKNLSVSYNTPTVLPPLAKSNSIGLFITRPQNQSKLSNPTLTNSMTIKTFSPTNKQTTEHKLFTPITKVISPFQKKLNAVYGVNKSQVKALRRLKANNKIVGHPNYSIHKYQDKLVKILSKNVSDEGLTELQKRLRLLNNFIENNKPAPRFINRWERLAQQLDHKVPQMLIDKFHYLGRNVIEKRKDFEKQRELEKLAKTIQPKKTIYIAEEGL